ncbi:MAG: hypothetical protein ACM34J_16255 [Ignavibacteria bacterium]
MRLLIAAVLLTLHVSPLSLEKEILPSQLPVKICPFEFEAIENIDSFFSVSICS